MTIDERIEFLVQSIESHDRQIGELTDRMSETDNRIAKLTIQVGDLTRAMGTLVTLSNEDATAIRALARIADSHDKRLSGLENTR